MSNDIGKPKHLESFGFRHTVYSTALEEGDKEVEETGATFWTYLNEVACVPLGEDFEQFREATMRRAKREIADEAMKRAREYFNNC